MVRPLKALEAHKGLIKELRDDDIPLPEICQILLKDHECDVSESTLKRRLHDWSFLKQIRLIETPELHLEIVYLFKDIGLPDGDIVRVLVDRGYEINVRKVREIRKRLGLRYCLLREEVNKAIEEVR